MTITAFEAKALRLSENFSIYLNSFHIWLLCKCICVTV